MNSTDPTISLSKPPLKERKPDTSYLWMYVVFVYLFTVLAIYLLVLETKKIIVIRQAYLGTQATVTDRTFRVSGIPDQLRSEEKIRTFFEGLEIGKVDSVMLCRDWKKLDDLIAKRTACLRRLEAIWAVHLGYSRPPRTNRWRPPDLEARDDGYENTQLLSESDMQRARDLRPRPMHTIRYGFLNLQGKKIDAIDYHEEKLRRYDKRISELRKKEFKPTALAFVTMESTATCQMAVQAILDPIPGQLLTTLAPPPADVVWQNTYLSRNTRIIRSWTIMIIIGIFSIFWAALLIPVAGLLSIEAIETYLPGLGDLLERHNVLRSFIQTSLPTLGFSSLAIGVPYLYDWLSNLQGMTSQGDVELSLISKNFFFTFFNLFIVFTIWGTASNFYDFWNNLQDVLKDTTGIAYALAGSLETLTHFYVNLIILQGIGLFPFRLLEFGSVVTYPIYLLWAATPRDHAELRQAPVFVYGYYLPQTLLVFVMCIVYSVLPSSWLMLLFGLVYFIIGSFIYKYQLLYAMYHRQHSTGQAWPMICNRIMVGVFIFQVAMVGTLALKGAITRAILLVPLIGGTIWYYLYFERTYNPLMNYIALNSIAPHGTVEVPTPPESTWDRDTDQGRAVDTSPDTGLRYINPNLVAPLEKLWVSRTTANGSAGQDI